MLPIPKGRRQVELTFGDPELRGGGVNEAWAKNNLTSVPLPYAMRNAFNPTGKPITNITVHKLIAHEFTGALQEVWDSARDEMKKKYGYKQTTAFYDNKTRAFLRLNGLDLFGGTWVYRAKRGSVGMSMHAYGISIDIDPANNAMGTKGRMPSWVVGIFAKHGFNWGGKWRGRKGSLSAADPMHFQRCSGC